jgi:hypothetical protein
MKTLYKLNIRLKFDVPSSSRSLVTAVKPRGTENFHTAIMLLFDIQHKYYVNQCLMIHARKRFRGLIITGATTVPTACSKLESTAFIGLQ